MFVYAPFKFPSMAAPAPQSSSSTAGDDRNLITIDENYLAPSFEDRVQMFWEKHGKTVSAVIVIAGLAIVARWGFEQYAASRERAIAEEYATAADDAALRAFAEANPKAALAGAAYLRLADQSYSANNFTAAAAEYQKAAAALVGQLLGERARMGAALSLLQAGDAAAAKSALEVLANDTAYARTLRGEAGFHLAVLARDAGQLAEASKWTDLVLSADTEGLWAQRAMQLRSSLPVSATELQPVQSELKVTPATVPTEPVSTDSPAAVSFPAAK